MKYRAKNKQWLEKFVGYIKARFLEVGVEVVGLVVEVAVVGSNRNNIIEMIDELSSDFRMEAYQE